MLESQQQEKILPEIFFFVKFYGRKNISPQTTKKKTFTFIIHQKIEFSILPAIHDIMPVKRNRGRKHWQSVPGCTRARREEKNCPVKKSRRRKDSGG